MTATNNWWGSYGYSTNPAENATYETVYLDDPAIAPSVILTSPPIEGCGVQTSAEPGGTPTPTSTHDGLGGGGNTATPSPTAVFPFPYCTVNTTGGDFKNLREATSSTATVLTTIPPNTTVYIVQSPETSSESIWYYVKYDLYWGWVNSVTLDLNSIDCFAEYPDPTQLPLAPTLTPSPTLPPPLDCIPYQQINGTLTFQPINPEHDIPAFKNLLPPCDPNGQPMNYIGINVTPDPRFDKQYDVMDAANSIELEYVRNLHYGPEDITPIVSPRPTQNPPNNDPNSTEYQNWSALWANPTEETRVAYERLLIRRSDNNSCGFVTIGYAMNTLGISSDVHPYEL